MLLIIELVILGFFAYWVIITIRRYTSKANFTNKNVWITGASSGIGEYLAYEFSRLGASLILSARN